MLSTRMGKRLWLKSYGYIQMFQKKKGGQLLNNNTFEAVYTANSNFQYL